MPAPRKRSRQAGSKDSAAVSVRKVLPPMPGKEADGGRRLP
ncbi:hypothetical protein B4135_1681 [Caldibacillus debilis]|uniref:Uncharacterized protein n=1 Tax=Caldibacillus debilis TaxID=301148 RepID=A0A150M968_9BACI|nr:hypothetical protein B4135_1681 [Caldibacillus debilis]